MGYGRDLEGIQVDLAEAGQHGDGPAAAAPDDLRGARRPAQGAVEQPSKHVAIQLRSAGQRSRRRTMALRGDHAMQWSLQCCIRQLCKHLLQAELPNVLIYASAHHLACGVCLRLSLGREHRKVRAALDAP